MHAKSVEITRLTIGFVDVCSDVVTDYIWLVVWNMAFTFPYIRNVIIPTDELIFFRGVESTNQYILGDVQLDIYPLVNKHSY